MKRVSGFYCARLADDGFLMGSAGCGAPGFRFDSLLQSLHCMYGQQLMPLLPRVSGACLCLLGLDTGLSNEAAAFHIAAICVWYCHGSKLIPSSSASLIRGSWA